jgi:hypothetical protein
MYYGKTLKNNQLTTTPSKVFFDLDMAYQNYIKPEAYEITLLFILDTKNYGNQNQRKKYL